MKKRKLDKEGIREKERNSKKEKRRGIMNKREKRIREEGIEVEEEKEKEKREGEMKDRESLRERGRERERRN